MNDTTRSVPVMTASVAVPAGIRLHELPRMLESLCEGLSGNAGSCGGELTLTLSGLDEIRRITVRVNAGDPHAFAKALTERLFRTPIPGSLRRMELALELKATAAGNAASADALSPSGLARRLQSRLGAGRVFHLSSFEETLPSASSHHSPVDDALARRPMASPASAASVRPTMILPEPIPLHTSGGEPAWHQEVLHVVEGPIRHADGSEARDYFVAEGSGGRRVWLYRPVEAEGRYGLWHLHGLFA